MNSVHESSSRTMSKNLTPEKYLVKPGQKQAECTKCTTLAKPRAQRPCRAPQRPSACVCAVPRALRPAQPVLKWAVAYFRFLLQYFFLILFFSLFPATGKFQNNYLYIFFFIFHNTQINFYKNLFSSIFFSFTL